MLLLSAARLHLRAPCAQVRKLHACSPHHFIFGKKFLARSLLRRRHHPTDEPLDASRLSFWNQWMLPEDLQLPAPADPLRRLGAGLVDGALSVAAGAALVAAASAVGAETATATEAGAAAALASWALRDALAPTSDGGCRSFGKRLFSLELARADGTLPSRAVAAARGAYWAALPAAAVHPLAGMAAGLLLVFDVASTLLTVDARKVGDYVAGTRVVDERPGRAGRVADAAAAEEIRALREEIEALAPGELAKSAHPDDEWYEVMQRPQTNAEIVASAREAPAGADGGAGLRAGAGESTRRPSPPSAAAAALRAAPPPRRER